jgi:GNAT superfamily N-acetyltransferase
MFLYGIFFLLNIVSLSFSNNKPDVVYLDFDPQNKSQYAQVLELMKKNKINLLDPDEDPSAALEEYKKALLGNPKWGLEGLRLKLLMTPDRKKVVGFISYLPQKESGRKLPYLVRTMAVDSEYQRLGLGTLLLSKVEQEAQEEDRPRTCLIAYSFNRQMLGLLEKRSYELRGRNRMDGYEEDVDTGERSPIFTFVLCKELKQS